MVQIDETGDPISEAEIAALEHEIGAKLPESYRHFLLSNNGGRPCPDTINIPDFPGGCSDIQFFFGFRQSFQSNNLSWNYELIEERHPGRRILPIACDSMGGLFCFRLSGEKTNEVIFCDMPDPAGTMYELAPDFETFLAKIRPWELSH